MNIWATQDAYIARLQSQAPAGVPVYATFDALDWTADDADTLGLHVVFDGLGPDDQTSNAVLMQMRFSAHTYLDTRRASATDRSNAALCVSAAIKAAAGWAPNHLPARITDGGQTGFDGRLARVSISFAVPVTQTGAA
jgi:hypothetical protein